jgi:hypothetical protein
VAGAGPRGRRDFFFTISTVLANDPPVTVGLGQRAQDGHTIFGMSRLRSAGSPAQPGSRGRRTKAVNFLAEARTPRVPGERTDFFGGVALT